ncbi:hypothetical protein [Vibrio sp. 10N.239.312.D08]|uniref:hypothetical protein n=1 Tax=Vibrio sp. 10N.239.312.D08 TaxID=3229978 RepID=UPI0035507DBC
MTNNNLASKNEGFGLVTITIGEKVPSWEQMRDRCFVSGFATTYDLYTMPNVGILYVMFDGMNTAEQSTLDSSPYICGVNPTQASVFDARFLGTGLSLTTCINSKKEVNKIVTHADSPFRLAIVGIEARTGVVKTLRGSILPPSFSTNLNAVVKIQEQLSIEQIDKLHENFLWTTPQEQTVPGMNYIQIGL